MWGNPGAHRSYDSGIIGLGFHGGKTWRGTRSLVLHRWVWMRVWAILAAIVAGMGVLLQGHSSHWWIDVALAWVWRVRMLAISTIWAAGGPIFDEQLLCLFVGTEPGFRIVSWECFVYQLSLIDDS
jgi:hypothetical protein